MDVKHFTMEREIGYYWCKCTADDGWEIAYWDGQNWRLPGDDNFYHDRLWNEIDSKQITRNKTPQR